MNLIKKPELILRLNRNTNIHFLGEPIDIIIDYFDGLSYIGSFTRNERLNICFMRYNNSKTPNNPPMNFRKNDYD